MINVNYEAKTISGFFGVSSERFDELNEIIKYGSREYQKMTSIIDFLKICEDLWNKNYPNISLQEKIFLTISLGIDIHSVWPQENYNK